MAKPLLPYVFGQIVWGPLQGQGFNELAVQALKANADERANGLASTIAALKAEGIVSGNGIASALNARGCATPRGGQWTALSE